MTDAETPYQPLHFTKAEDGTYSVRGPINRDGLTKQECLAMILEYSSTDDRD